MKLTLLPADSAQTDAGGKAHALGLGWSLTTSPIGEWALLLIVELEPEDEPQTRYKMIGKLVDASGEQQRTHKGAPVEFRVEMEANLIDGKIVRRGGDLPVPERVMAAITLPRGLKLEPGRYDWVVTVEEPQVEAHVGFGVIVDRQLIG